MNNLEFVLFCSVMGFGLWLIKFGHKQLGAIIFSWGMFMFLSFLPWTTVAFLMKSSRAFRHWATPRLPEIRLIWGLFSLLFSGLIAFFIARAKAKGAKDPSWETPGEEDGLDDALEAALDPRCKSESTFLGMARGERPVSLTSLARESHMQIVGPTRSGKSQLLFALTAQDMRREMPVFFMEAKGDHSDFNQFLSLAARCGRLDSVRYFNPADPRSQTFNPIRPLPGQDPTSLANQIARVIGREPTSSGEAKEYYLSVDFSRIQTMAEIFWKTQLEFSLEDCFYYFAYEECREKAFEESSDGKLADAARREFELNADTTSLTSAIRPWISGTLGRLLNTYSPQIRLEDIFTCRQLAYFAIPIGHLQVLANPLGRMVISGLLSIATGRQQARRKPGPASVVLDEFSEFATPAFSSFISTVGSAKLWTILSHQDLGQLEKVLGTSPKAFASGIFNNTSGCKVCFRTPDPDDAEYWSQTIGTFSTYEDTERIERGFLGDRKTGEMSRRWVEHFKIHPNKLKNLAPGTAMVFTPGQQPCLTRTARVFKLLDDWTPELPFVEGEYREGLDLASVVKHRQDPDAGVGPDGVKQ